MLGAELSRMGQSLSLTIGRGDNMDHSASRTTTFIILFSIFFLGGVFADIFTWSAHSTLTHSLLQSVATVLALFCGSAALYRFYNEQNKNNMLLFIGVGFMGTTVMDAYHTVVTANWFLKTFPNVPETVIEWSWLSTRAFLSILLVLGMPSMFREKATTPAHAKIIYGMVSVLTLLILVLFMFVKIPLPIYPEQFIARPLELIPGALFLMALTGFLIQGHWKTDTLEFWMVLFLITSISCQFFYIDLSKHAHDLQYIVAHIMKIFSYTMVYLGVTSVSPAKK